jgi:hypothetical protein
MKVSTFALASSLALCHSDAFSVLSSTSNHPKSTTPRGVPLAAEKSSNTWKADFAKGASSFAVAVAIGWGVTLSGASAVDMLPEVHPSFSAEASSSVTLAIGEYADFSMPSYRDAIDAPVMTNLKGEKMAVITKFGDSEESTSR